MNDIFDILLEKARSKGYLPELEKESVSSIASESISSVEKIDGFTITMNCVSDFGGLKILKNTPLLDVQLPVLGDDFSYSNFSFSVSGFIMIHDGIDWDILKKNKSLNICLEHPQEKGFDMKGYLVGIYKDLHTNRTHFKLEITSCIII